jgi:hypothetical protein
MRMTKPRGSFKFHESNRLVDPTMDPIDVDAIYNDIPNGVLPMKNTQQAWRGVHKIVVLHLSKCCWKHVHF